jgi:conjugal transfer mating pair stabilization protein TraN
MKAWCITKKNAYCCFNNKINRLIQEDGRKQLNISWGASEYPDCEGLSPDDLSGINFEDIDFSEIHQDVLANFKKHEANTIKERVQDMVTREMHRGSYDKR